MSEEQVQQAIRKYRERYDVDGIFECCLYDGIAECIQKLKKKGYVIALASSKPEIACRRILEHFGLLPYFDEVAGSTLDGSISTKQQVLEELYRRVRAQGMEKKDMCLIGDTKFDAMGAKEFGIDCVGVTYGFGTREELTNAGAVAVFDRIEEVEAYIEAELGI